MTTRKIHANSTNSAHSAGARIKLLTQASRHRSENGKRFCSCGRKPTCTFLFAIFTALNLSLAIVCVRWFSCQLVANVADISECKQELLWNIHNCTNLCSQVTFSLVLSSCCSLYCDARPTIYPPRSRSRRREVLTIWRCLRIGSNLSWILT